MTLTVDWSRLESRRSQWASVGLEDDDGGAEDMVELWVSIPGVGAEDGEHRVLTAADVAWAGTPGSPWTVSGSAAGVYVARAVPRDRWREAVESLVGALGQGTGTVTTPPPLPSNPASGRVVAQAFLAFTVSPPPEEGPFYPNGTLVLRWGVDPDLTRRLVDQACSWAAVAGDVGRVGPFVPTSPATAARTVMRTWHPGNLQHSLLFAADATGSHARAVVMAEFGLTSWTDLTAGDAPADQASALVPLLTEYAPFLDYAHVGPGTTTLLVDRDPATEGRWRTSRELWASRVPAPYSVQLLTAEHMERVGDLSGWDVRQVAPERWLVVARDLGEWWDFPGATTVWEAEQATQDVRARARTDFGDLVLPS